MGAIKKVIAKTSAKAPRAKIIAIARKSSKDAVSKKLSDVVTKPEVKQRKVRGPQTKRIIMTPQIMAEILRRHAKGEAIYRICSGPSMPEAPTFYDAVNNNPEYAAAYNRSLGHRSEKFADELSEMADQALGGSSDDIQALKLMVNTRQWIVSRLLPKKYGDKMTIAGDAENPLVTKLVMGGDSLVKKIKGGSDE